MDIDEFTKEKIKTIEDFSVKIKGKDFLLFIRKQYGTGFRTSYSDSQPKILQECLYPVR